ESINTPEIQGILREMKEALNSQDDGVAIAAPQIGYPLRIFVVSHKVEEIVREEKADEKAEEKPEENKKISDRQKKDIGKDLIFINPVLKKVSKERKIVEEGCLSVRYLYGKVSR